MRVLSEIDSKGVYKVEVEDLREGFELQLEHCIKGFKKDKERFLPSQPEIASDYRKGVKWVKKLTGCSRRQAHKIFSLVYSCSEAFEALLRQNPFLDHKELSALACEVLAERLTLKMRLPLQKAKLVEGVLMQRITRGGSSSQTQPPSTSS